MRVKRRVWRMHSTPSSTQRDVSYHSAVDSTGHCLRFGFLVNGKIKRNARRIQEKKNARKVLAIRRNSPQRRAHTSAMVSNSESNANTPSSSRVVTPSPHSDAREADYDVKHGSPPPPSVANLAIIRAKRVRATADAICDAIGEIGRVKELLPVEDVIQGRLCTLKSFHRSGILTFED